VALPPDAARTIVRYQDQVSAVRDKVLSFVRRTFGSLDSWREADIDRFVAAVVPVVGGGQRVVAALTDNYLATIERQILGSGAALGIPTDVVTDETMRGVPAAEVYRRTGSTIYGSLSRGAVLSAAVGAGLARAVNTASTDLQLARTHSSRYVGMRAGEIVGFRRVLSAGACSLCTGSTAMFGRQELMPIHGHCTCGSVPVFRGGPDPGEIDEGAPSSDDRGTPVVHEHTEIGPVLASADDDFASL
jgi:hypothetical protein